MESKLELATEPGRESLHQWYRHVRQTHFDLTRWTRCDLLYSSRKSHLAIIQHIWHGPYKRSRTSGRHRHQYAYGVVSPLSWNGAFPEIQIPAAVIIIGNQLVMGNVLGMDVCLANPRWIFHKTICTPPQNLPSCEFSVCFACQRHLANKIVAVSPKADSSPGIQVCFPYHQIKSSRTPLHPYVTLSIWQKDDLLWSAWV